jgi:hypothetical protein
MKQVTKQNPKCRTIPPPEPAREGDWIHNIHLGFVHHHLGMCGPGCGFILHLCSLTGSDKSLKAACDEHDAHVYKEVQLDLDDIMDEELAEHKRITKLQKQLAEERMKLDAAQQCLTDA